MEKDTLQTLKIEISKNFKLIPYERMAFHKILGITKSENGMKVLVRELGQDAETRESAISVLKDFNNLDVLLAFIELLRRGECSDIEKLYMLEHVERRGSAADVADIISCVEACRAGNEDSEVIARGFAVLRVIGFGSEELFGYFSSIIKNRENGIRLKCLAIEGLSSFKDISLFEDIIRQQNEEMTYSAYKSLSMLSDTLMKDAQDARTEADIPYTYSPEYEDRLILDIRVLLGKMTPQFDSYSNRIKVAFISAMISSNHREFIIYTMKALTSEDSELVDLIILLLLANVNKLRDPDKLFRNLLALSADSSRKNEIIVNIFERYFSGMKDNRMNMLFRDKLFNYIVVTLETYFETYRKEFMITEVIEKDFPESFQNIRKFLLEKFSPSLKKRLANFLRNNDRNDIQIVVTEMCRAIPYFEKEDKEKLHALIEILFDADHKSRSNSSMRIEDINFEKRYLRNRILRICSIVGRLKIDGAASLLVKIFNYVKKYPDEEIFAAVGHSLSMLNYSYMLGELEVLLASGGEEDQSRAVRYLSLFSDQRAFNILLDYMKERTADESELVVTVLNILVGWNIVGNMAANAIFKRIVEKNGSLEIRRLAVLCMGKCGLESDIDYLNDLFYRLTSRDEKEAVVQALGYIMQYGATASRRQVIKYLTEYLKEPDIKVRIYACSILIQLGNKDAVRFVRDMMIIKNKYFQRGILGIIGSQNSVEFAYFMISLLKPEYGIANDIVATLAILPESELKEIDQFVVNVFKKYAGTELEPGEHRESSPSAGAAKTQRASAWVEKTILNLDIYGYRQQLSRMNVIEIINTNKLIEEFIISVITDKEGIICALAGGNISAYFNNPLQAADAALKIRDNITAYNLMRLPSRESKISMQLFTSRVKILSDDLLNLPEFLMLVMKSFPIVNRVIVDESCGSALEHSFRFDVLPGIVSRYAASFNKYSELISPVNSLVMVQGIIDALSNREKGKILAQTQIEAELKKHKSDHKAGTGIEYARAMDEVGTILKAELNEIVKYVQKRSTDRELISTVEKMVSNVNKRYVLETTKIIMQ